MSRRFKKAGEYTYQGNALPAGEYYDADYPFASVTDHPTQKPPHLDEVLYRKQYASIGQPWGDLPKFDPEKYAELNKHFDKEAEYYVKNKFAIAAVDAKTVYDRMRLDDLRPQIKEAHRRARDKLVGLSERLFRLMEQRCIKTEDDLEFLYHLLDPQVVVPLFPEADPFGLWFWQVYADKALHEDGSWRVRNAGLSTATTKADDITSRLSAIKSGLYGKRQFYNYFSDKCKSKIVKRMIPGYKGKTDAEIETFIEGLFTRADSNPIEKGKRKGVGNKVDKGTAGGKFFEEALLGRVAPAVPAP